MSAKLVTVTLGGKTFKTAPEMAYKIQVTISRLAVEHPKARLEFIQVTFSDGPRSAGTHNEDGTYDLRIRGLSWLDGLAFLKSCGWWVWWRHTGDWAAESDWHFHGGPLVSGIPNNPSALAIGKAYKKAGVIVGEYVDGGYTTTGRVYTSSQIHDYYNDSLGLKGQHNSGIDPTSRPKNINATVIPYPPKEKPVSKTPNIDAAIVGTRAAIVASQAALKTATGTRKTKLTFVINGLHEELVLLEDLRK